MNSGDPEQTEPADKFLKATANIPFEPLPWRPDFKVPPVDGQFGWDIRKAAPGLNDEALAAAAREYGFTDPDSHMWVGGIVGEINGLVAAQVYDNTVLKGCGGPGPKDDDVKFICAWAWAMARLNEEFTAGRIRAVLNSMYPIEAEERRQRREAEHAAGETGTVSGGPAGGAALGSGGAAARGDGT